MPKVAQKVDLFEKSYQKVFFIIKNLLIFISFYFLFIYYIND